MWAQFWVLAVLRSLLLFLAVLLASVFLSTVSTAGVYSWTDAYGRIHFSDTPVQGAIEHRGGTASSIHNPDYNLELNMKKIPYQSVGGNMLVNGKVNGISMRFIVDTGASFVVIPSSIARRANIRTESAGQVTLDTANGRVQAPLVRLKQLDVASISIRGVSAVVQDIGGDGMTGLLGMNVLGAYTMTVDRQRNLLLLEKR